MEALKTASIKDFCLYKRLPPVKDCLRKSSRLLERLHKKCLLSGFNNKMLVRILSIAKTWTDRFQAPPTPNHEESTNSRKTLVWVTPFSNVIKLDQRVKHLAPHSIYHL